MHKRVRAHPLLCLTSLPYPHLLPPIQGCLVLEQSLAPCEHESPFLPSAALEHPLQMEVCGSC